MQNHAETTVRFVKKSATRFRNKLGSTFDGAILPSTLVRETQDGEGMFSCESFVDIFWCFGTSSSQPTSGKLFDLDPMLPNLHPDAPWYGVFTYILRGNVCKYSLHGASGIQPGGAFKIVWYFSLQILGEMIKISRRCFFGLKAPPSLGMGIFGNFGCKSVTIC